MGVSRLELMEGELSFGLLAWLSLNDTETDFF